MPVVQHCFRRYNKKSEAYKIGVAANTSKIDYMKGRGLRDDKVSLPQRIRIDGDDIEVVNEFVYLGSLVDKFRDALWWEIVPTLGSEGRYDQTEYVARRS